jgi:hypothetical protein
MAVAGHQHWPDIAGGKSIAHAPRYILFVYLAILFKWFPAICSNRSFEYCKKTIYKFYYLAGRGAPQFFGQKNALS